MIRALAAVGCHTTAHRIDSHICPRCSGHGETTTYPKCPECEGRGSILAQCTDCDEYGFAGVALEINDRIYCSACALFAYAHARKFGGDAGEAARVFGGLAYEREAVRGAA